MPTSPSVDNYFIGKGIVHFTKQGGARRDLGDVSEFEMTPSIERLDHFSHRTGTRTKDRSVVVERSMELRLVMDEITAENLAILMLGDDPEVGSSAGVKEFEIFSVDEIRGRVEFDGTNDVGQQVRIDLPDVSFGPSGSFSPISDEWGTLEVTGEITNSTGSFGTILVAEAA